MSPTIITKDIAVGSFRDVDKMKKEGWITVCVASGEDVPRCDANYELIDGSGNNKETIKSAILEVLNLINNEEKVYVCCRQGMNRSPLIAAAALAAAAKVEWLSTGLILIASKRNVSTPSDRDWET